MGPIDRAYAALAAALTGALVGSGLLESAEKFEIDPASPMEPTGEADEVFRWAGLVRLPTTVQRQMLGSGAGRFVVEMDARLELAVAGPEKAWRDQVWAAALPALSNLPEADPTLGGTAERFWISAFEPDDFPPNGAQALVTFTLRVRSGDRLGLSE